MIDFAWTGTSRLVVERGDLTRSAVDAVVNAANEAMLGGGGVDGAIHRAAGPALRRACEQVSEVRPGVRCPTGEARVTPGYELEARFVIHTVGPVYASAEESAPLLAAAHRSSMQLADERGLRSIAFPAISCGVFGYPPDEAAPIAVETCRAHLGGLEELRFVLFDARTFDAWRRAAERACGTGG